MEIQFSEKKEGSIYWIKDLQYKLVQNLPDNTNRQESRELFLGSRELFFYKFLETCCKLTHLGHFVTKVKSQPVRV